MKKKIIAIILSITIIGLIACNIYFILEIKEKDEIIDKLENKIEKEEKKNKNFKNDINELEYRIDFYENMFGKYEPEEEPIEEEKLEPKQITYKEYKKLLTQKKTFVLFISQTYCSHCIDYKPKFAEAIKKNQVEGYELDLLTLTETEYEELTKDTGVNGTPTTIFYRDGKEIENSRLLGSKNVDEITTALKKHNYIK
jgi:thiol-disulfide isomerase/thioredoxin